MSSYYELKHMKNMNDVTMGVGYPKNRLPSPTSHNAVAVACRTTHNTKHKPIEFLSLLLLVVQKYYFTMSDPISFTDKQKIKLSIIPKPSSVLSIIGSSYIIYRCTKMLLRGTHTRKKHRFSAIYNRILIALSVCDLISSLAFFISPWALPADDTKERSILNTGNQMTCNTQGFMLQFGLLAGLMYNTCLAVYFYIFVWAKIRGEDIGDLHQTNNVQSSEEKPDSRENKNDYKKENANSLVLNNDEKDNDENANENCLVPIDDEKGNDENANENSLVRNNDDEEDNFESNSADIDVEKEREELENNSSLDRRSNNKKNIVAGTTKNELLLHFSILFYPFFTATLLVSQGYMNPESVNCWINEYPRGCVGDECIRGGKNTILYRVILMQLPVMICIIIIMFSMIFLHRSVKRFSRDTMNTKSENPSTSTSRNTGGESSNNNIFISYGDETPRNIDNLVGESDVESTPNMNQSISRVCKKVRRLAMLYLFSCLSVWVPMVIQTLVYRVFVGDPGVYFYSVAFLQFVGPLQGFFNAWIFSGFNPLVCIYQNILPILASGFVIAASFFLFCDPETCTYNA